MLFRTHIRRVTVDRLRTLGLFESVFDARSPVIVREQLPCCKVWTPSEGGDNLSIGVPEIRGVCDLIVQIVVEGVQDEEVTARSDDLCERVALFLIEDPMWQVQFERLLALNTEIETNAEGELRTVTATMSFSLQYNYLYITRIPDNLETMDVVVVPPMQPDGPAGEPGEANVRFVVEPNV
jgi:hypothetical protein